MADAERVAVVSGGNRGIGREICRQLAGQGYTAVLGSRDAAQGEAVASELSGNGGGAVVARQLDVTDRASIDGLGEAVSTELGRVDVLVNNAGVLGDTGARGGSADLDEVRRTLDINLFGAWGLTETLLPLLRRSGHGRIVNLSSGMGQLSDMGGGAPAYRVSKAGLNVLTRILATEERDNGILVNSVCPGWVRTDMGGRSASRSVEEGADTPVWLATLPDDGPTGGFFRDRKEIPW